MFFIYPKLVSSIQMPSRIFFFATKKQSLEASRAVTAPGAIYKRLREAGFGPNTRLSWRMSGPLAQPSHPLPSPAIATTVSLPQFWVALTPMKERKVANRYESGQVCIKARLCSSWLYVCSWQQGQRPYMVLINRINWLHMYFGTNLWPMASFPGV